MHSVKVDVPKNRLYLVIGELDGTDEMEQAVIEITGAIGKLKPGFDCITDLREYTVKAEEEEHYILKGQEIMMAAGLNRVVRVVKKFGVLGHYQFDKKSMELGYHAKSVMTMKEAEDLLDAPDDRN